MEHTYSSADVQPQRQRRAGTFTLGLALVVFGLLLLASMFLPQVDWRWLAWFAPMVFISLGIEVLIAARGDCKVRYDWAGMILTALLICVALSLSAAFWIEPQVRTWAEEYAPSAYAQSSVQPFHTTQVEPKAMQQ